MAATGVANKEGRERHNMNEKLTRRAFLGVAGSAALTLAACGGNGGGAPAPEGGSEGGEPEPEPSAESTTGKAGR